MTGWVVTRCEHLGSPSSLPPELRDPFDDAACVAVVGNWPGCARGLAYDLSGTLAKDPKYGWQVALKDPPQLVQPSDRDGLIAMLASENVAHLGPMRAADAVDRFGVEGVIAVLEDEPERLAEIKGITIERAQAAAEGWAALKASQVSPEVRRSLYSLGLTHYQVLRLCAAYGNNAADVLREDPYRTTDLDGIGFLTADHFRRAAKISDDDPRRVRAAVEHILALTSEEGHTCAPASRVSALVRLDKLGRDKGLGVDVDEEAVDREFDRLISARKIVDVGDGRLALSRLRAAEERIAEQMIGLVTATAPPLRAVDVDAALAPYGLTDEQEKAPAALRDVGVVIVTGGPGTGKTHTLRAACDLLSASGASVVLAAPTGKAARRMEEATGRPALTVHRLLRYRPGVGFEAGPDNPVGFDVVVVDEASMLDAELAEALLMALVPGRHRLALVGDVNQLPSVGPGAVLRDLIDSEAIPVVWLSKILRQKEGSNIVGAAHAVIRGERPCLEDWPAPGRDFKVRLYDDETPALQLADDLVSFVVATLPRFAEQMDCDVRRDVQVLSSMRRADVGVDKLNTRIRELLNPPLDGEPIFAIGKTTAEGEDRSFRRGDKVIQTKNDYQRGVFNGETGVVVGVEPGRELLVDFGDATRDFTVSYDAKGARSLFLSYALTIHKSQGSEWPIVVIPVHSSHAHMWSRQLLYTAITRAARLCVIFATDKALALAVRSNQADKRNTTLCEMLQRKG